MEIDSKDITACLYVWVCFVCECVVNLRFRICTMLWFHRIIYTETTLNYPLTVCT